LSLQLEAIPADKTIVEDHAKLLGPLFVEENLLAPEQLERALRFSRNTGLPLDQIVVAEFPHLRRPIGQIFVDLGFITPEDREAALTVQREDGGLLGEILITQGKITRLELANALSEHWESATGASDTTANRGPSLIDVPRGDESSRRVEPFDALELRRLLAELEAARVAAVQAAEAGLRAIDEALAALVQARTAETEGTRIANDELRKRLDELIALRTADLETSQAAQSQAAHATAEASRIEETLAGALAALAVQVEDLAHRFDNPPAEVSEKRSKRAKDKKKPKR
jgi:hypothetical protein